MWEDGSTASQEPGQQQAFCFIGRQYSSVGAQYGEVNMNSTGIGTLRSGTRSAPGAELNQRTTKKKERKKCTDKLT